MRGLSSIASNNTLLANEPAETSMELLEASRRVDWRFLLPSTPLEQVAYFGPQTDLLCNALRSFSESLTVFPELPYDREDNRQFDVLVVVDPCSETLRRSAQIVRPGGALYIEINRRRRHQHTSKRPGGGNTNKKISCSADYVDAIQQLGFSDVRAYWHCPDFESCTVIVPITGHTAHLRILQRRAASPKTKAKALFARCLLRCGLLDKFIPCFSIVAQKGVK